MRRAACISRRHAKEEVRVPTAQRIALQRGGRGCRMGAMGVSPLRLFGKVILPGSLPTILGGAPAAGTIARLGASEMVGAEPGLGPPIIQRGAVSSSRRCASASWPSRRWSSRRTVRSSASNGCLTAGALHRPQPSQTSWGPHPTD